MTDANRAGVPPWAQEGVTDVREASRFLVTLRRRDLLSLNCSDADCGYTLTVLQNRRRGRSLSVSDCTVAGGLPRADLHEYHRDLGIAPSRLYVPQNPSWRTPLPRCILDDPHLLERIRNDSALRSIFFFFKDRAAEDLQRRLGLEPVYCAPPAAVYERANDKLVFSEAARRLGFPAVNSEELRERDEVAEAYRRASHPYGEGCILRGRRGAGGSGIRHAGSIREAERIWGSMHRRGAVLIQPYVPPSRILHNVCVSGIILQHGFAPLCVTEQLQKKMAFRGGRTIHAWSDEAVRAVHETMDGVARWLLDLGYVGAPVGIDGFLMRERGGLRFLALDPNIRVTGSMMAWALSAVLCEMSGTPFLWAFEWLRVVGRPLSMALLRQRLGPLLVDPRRLEEGGILPRDLSTLGIAPLAMSWISVLYLARSTAHLERLRVATHRLGFYTD